jgi:hypothetical protein
LPGGAGDGACGASSLPDCARADVTTASAQIVNKATCVHKPIEIPNTALVRIVDART